MIFYPINSQQGYIALVSAIVISVLLLAITVSLGMSGFFQRLDVLDLQSKESSRYLAEACVNEAILQSASGVYPLDETVAVGTSECLIVSSQENVPSAGQTSIKTRGIVNQAYTYLDVIINSESFEIVSFRECAIASCL